MLERSQVCRDCKHWQKLSNAQTIGVCGWNSYMYIPVTSVHPFHDTPAVMKEFHTPDFAVCSDWAPANSEAA